ncbi:MAG TPA: class I SAM-dependent methyltransferase [Thermoanaerobaculia bacterium]|nr:class I SAM-dependent methyltransferase [Thermoanaerobaculia bacterium]
MSDGLPVSERPTSAAAGTKALASLAAAFPWPAARPLALEVPERNQGWLRDGSRDALASALSASTRVVVELGAWLGLSTRFVLERARNATVISVDHWQGSPEHHESEEWRRMLPALYETFLAMNWEHRARIVPVRRSTIEGLEAVAAHGVAPDVVYVDAGHEYESVLEDLETSYRLFPEAELVGDDFDWLGVRQALEKFRERHGFEIVRFRTGWRLRAVGGADER